MKSNELAQLCVGCGVLAQCRRLLEVGVNAPGLAQVRAWLDAGDVAYDAATLVEPLAYRAKELRDVWGSNSKISIVEAAVTESGDSIEMFNSDQGSFTAEIKYDDAPTVAYRHFAPTQKIVVPAVRMASIDDGKADLVAIDVEGAEMTVLAGMVSRPKILTVETHCLGRFGMHPRIDDILKWMDGNRYKLVGIFEADMAWMRRD